MEALGEESKLRVVGEEAGQPDESGEESSATTSAPKPQEASRVRRSGGVWLWGLVGLLLGMAVAFQQYRRAEGLELEVSRLDAALLEAQRQIKAYDDRFSDVRIRVGDLDQRVEELKVLVESDPTAPVPSVSPGQSAGSIQNP